MRRLRDTHGSSIHRRHIRFHLSRCKGVSPLHDKLHDEASAAYIALRDAQRTREDAEDAVTSAAAMLARAEVGIENAIREIDAEAKRIDRADPAQGAHSTILPAGLGPVIRPDGSAQLDVLPALRVRMAPLEGKGAMAAAIAGLDAAEAGQRAALAAVVDAAAEVERCFAEERLARRAVREQIESAYGRLRDHYKARPGLAEQFFLREKEPAREKKGEEAGQGTATA
jgi:hypothetical protein